MLIYYRKGADGMEKISLRDFVESIDISTWWWSTLGDLDIIEDLGDGRYIAQFSAKQVINDEPTLYVIDADAGMIEDEEGNVYQITDWGNDITVYCEVAETDYGIEVVDTKLTADF